MLNGHEYVACQARTAHVAFTKQDNCFTAVPNAADLAHIADTLSRNETAGRLRQLCERWVYTACLCFALDLEATAQRFFLPVLGFPDRVQPQSVVPVRPANGRSGPGID